MNNQSLSKILILIIVIVLVTGGFLIYRYLLSAKEEVKAPEVKTSKEVKTSEEAKEPEEASKHEVADWMVYRNDEYGFEIKYPKDWHIEAKTNPTLTGQKPGAIKIGVSFGNYPPAKGLKKKDWRLIYLGVEEASITKWLNKMKETEGRVEEITINPLKGYKAVNPVGVYAFCGGLCLCG